MSTRAIIFTCCGSIHDVTCPTCAPSSTDQTWFKMLHRSIEDLRIHLNQAEAALRFAEAELAAERAKFAAARQKSMAIAKLMNAGPVREICAQLAESLGLVTLAEKLKGRA